jgi:uncharacterized membrane protein
VKPRIPLILFLLGCVAGIVFATISAGDFAQHLDRQVHSIHCSILPGGAPDVSGSSGCHVALMSPYASFLKGVVWGGIPVALPGIALFVFMAYRAMSMWAGRRQSDRTSVVFLILISALPVLTSLVFGGIAIFELETLCKTCLGIYLSSFVCFGSALGLLVKSGKASYEDEGAANEADDDPVARPAPNPVLHHLTGLAESGVFVVVPLIAYVALAPDHSVYAGQCGTLTNPEDPYGVFVPLGQQTTGEEAIEVFDPLCPACAGFEKRLVSSGLDAELKRKAVLFPLDNACNWMVSSALHPGACTISEAVLCAGPEADAVVAWAFEQQDAIRTAAATDPEAAKRMVVAAFPSVAKCVGSPDVKTKINRSLRWAVTNKLPVLTPQLYVGGTKLCDEDTDLGLDYALAHLLDREAP